MEDDADWSIYLKSQLSLFAEGTQYILSTPSSKRHPHSPYGEDWDLLWLGHCGAKIRDNDQRRFIVENDNTVPLPEHRYVSATESLNMTQEGFDDRTRVIFEAGGGSCTYAYALSNAGAKKMIQRNNAMKEFTPIGTSLRSLCGNDESFKCLSVSPSLVDAHRPAGASEREGGWEGEGGPARPEEGRLREDARTPNILHSQRMNIDNSLRKLGLGDGKDWRQWAEEPMVEGPARTRTMNRQPVVR